MFCAEKARRRYFSEDLHTRARRFGTPVTVAFTLNQETARHQIEVVVHTQYFKKSAAPFVFIIELRRLLFWVAMLVLITSAGAFRVMPRGQKPIYPRSMMPSASVTSASIPVQIATSPAAVVANEMTDLENEATPDMLVNPLLDEAALQLGKVGHFEFGADEYDVAAVTSQMLALFSDGEFTLDKIKVYFSRACLSALMHKFVGTGLTLASCMIHH